MPAVHRLNDRKPFFYQNDLASAREHSQNCAYIEQQFTFCPIVAEQGRIEATLPGLKPERRRPRVSHGRRSSCRRRRTCRKRGGLAARAGGVWSCCMRCALRQTEAHKTGALPSSSARIRSARTNGKPMPSACCMRKCAEPLADHGGRRCHKLPAGGALAVDREGFAARRDPRDRSASSDRDRPRGDRRLPPAALEQRHRGDGPPTSPALARAIQALTGEAELAFFDAIAPIVHRDSIDMDVCWLQSRYDKRSAAEAAPTTSTARSTRTSTRLSWRRCSPPRKPRSRNSKATPYFEGCLPIEVMAERGRDTLRFGPMKPVGLDPKRPHVP